MKNSIYKFLKDKSGNFAITFGLSLAPLIVLTGIAVDYSNIERTRARMQESLDSATLYAFSEFKEKYLQSEHKKTPDEALEEYARKIVYANYDGEAKIVKLDVHAEPNKIMASLETSFEPAFIKIIQYDNVAIGVVSEVTYSFTQDPPICIFLKSQIGVGLELNGSSDIFADGCDIHVNSSDARAVDLSSATSIKATRLCVVGDVGAGESAIDATVSKGCEEKSDPFALETKPTLPTTCHQPSPYSIKKSTTIDASIDGTNGVYMFCGDVNIGGNADFTLNNGIFVFQNSWLTMDGNADLLGENAVLYFVGNDVGISMTGNAGAKFSGKESGVLAGYAIYFDPSATYKSDTTLWGNAVKDFEGIMYLGDADLVLGGNASMNSSSSFSVLIANTLQLNGSSDITYKIDDAKTDLKVPDILKGKENIVAHLSR